MEKFSTLFCVRTGESFKFPNFSFDEEHPSTWFREHPKSKPVVKSYKSGKYPGDLRKAISTVINGASINVTTVIEFLLMCLRKQSATLTEQWKSYDIIISEAGDISPLQLLGEEETAYELSDVNVRQDPGEKAELWMCLMIVGVYGINKTTNETYRKSLINKLTQLMQGQGAPASISLQLLAKENNSWIDSSDYKKIIAAIDMFFYRFHDHKWAVLRAGTNDSRFKDCASISVFQSISEVLGCSNPEDLKCWFFGHELYIESKNMFRPDEEHNLKYSYFPYQIDLGICRRSSYTVKCSPGIHYFCNVVGIIFELTRCVNSKMLLKNDVLNITKNALLVGYVFRTRATRSQRMPTTSKDQTNVAIKAKNGPCPLGEDPERWFNWCEERDWEPDETMLEFFQGICRSIKNPRPGTTAEYLKKYLQEKYPCKN